MGVSCLLDWGCVVSTSLGPKSKDDSAGGAVGPTSAGEENYLSHPQVRKVVPGSLRTVSLGEFMFGLCRRMFPRLRLDACLSI